MMTKSTTVSVSLALMTIMLLSACYSDQAAPDNSPAADSAPRIEIPNLQQPLPGLLTGGQPTRDQFREAAAAGFKTVLNLRTLGEEGAWDEAEFVEQLGMRYVHLPIAGIEGLSAENAKALAALIDDEQTRPVLAHCRSGARVGALIAIKASVVDGAGIDEALELGRRAGISRLEDPIREKLEAGYGSR